MKDKLDKFSYHEALDRASSVAEIMENMLINHPVIQKHEELKELVEKAQYNILEAYQLIGKMTLK